MLKKQHRSKRSRFVPFSKKQRKVLSWWHPSSPVKEADGIIADGSVRAGKTFPMSISFIEWAFCYFQDENFAVCGKTVGSIRRNVLVWLKASLLERGYLIHEKRTENMLVLGKNGITNTFYVFGGRDESSQDLIQGLTLAGVFFDEVALMPESFVNQATARCSVEGAKMWFNCNPGSPSHWFKLKWLDKHRFKKLLHLHFTMDDNPSLDENTRSRYKTLWQGVFYQRFILGLWVMAEGAIYPMLNDDNFYEGDLSPLQYHTLPQYTSCDYGTYNPTTFLHIVDDGTTLFIDREYYHSGRDSEQLGKPPKTDSHYADDYLEFINGYSVIWCIIDPSAASFKAELATRGILTRDADNDVLDGIRMVASGLQQRIIKINRRCENLIRELQSYVWDAKASDKGEDAPLKKNDHGPDALRYFIKTMIPAYRLNIEYQ